MAKKAAKKTAAKPVSPKKVEAKATKSQSKAKPILKKELKTKVNAVKVKKDIPEKALKVKVSKNGEEKTAKKIETKSTQNISKSKIEKGNLETKTKVSSASLVKEDKFKLDSKSDKKKESNLENEVDPSKDYKIVRLSREEKSKMTDDQIKWWDLHERNKSIKAPMYDMKEAFESQKPIMHKLLGWGFVLNNDNDRLEVLFKDGKRMLISNRK